MPNEVTDRTGFRRFDYKRFAAVAAWFCEKLGEVSSVTINKFMFYADFLSSKISTVSLTGVAYVRLKYGPVPADYRALFGQLDSDGILASEEKEVTPECLGLYYSVGPIVKSLDVEFTAQEQEVLEHVVRELGGLTATAISERSHQESAWMDTGDKEFISFASAASLSLSLPQ